MAVDTIARSHTKVFPKTAVEAKLSAVLLDAAQSDATMNGTTLPTDIPGKCAASIRLDSLDVVALLCEIEPIVDFELKDHLVRAGGYNSVNEAMGHLMPRIEKAWDKNGKK
jgi:hypothetical protein